jgi:ADP-ribose pyrophosphatase
MEKQVRTLESKTAYHGRVVDLKVERIVEPDGFETTREVVYHPGSVVVVPHLPDGRLVLVRQYRYAVRASLWELVAGGLDPGETPIDAGRRELMEEAGYHAAVVEPRLHFYPSPGVLGETMHLVEAWDLTPAKGEPDEDERIEVGTFAIPELLEMIKRKEIHDAKTLVGLLFLFGSGAAPAAASADLS